MIDGPECGLERRGWAECHLPPRTMHRRVLSIREEYVFLESSSMNVPLLRSSANLDLQEIAVPGPYSGVFASTPCSIFGLHEDDQDKAMFECSRKQAFPPHEIRI